MLRTFPRQLSRHGNSRSYVHPSFKHVNFPVFSTMTEPLGESGQPKKPRRWFRKFLLVALFSSASAAGLLYTSKYFRNLLTDNYPQLKPGFKKAGDLIGGWYDENQRIPETSPTTDTVLPFVTNDEKTLHFDSLPPKKEFSAPSRTSAPPVDHTTTGMQFEITDSDSHSLSSDAGHGSSLDSQPSVVLPTVEDVMQMTRESSKSSQIKAVDIGQSLSSATKAVQTANLSLAALESATRQHIDGLRSAIQSNEVSKTRKWEQVTKLAALKERAESKANTAVDDAREQLNTLRQAINDYEHNEGSIRSDTLPDSISTYGHLQYNLSGAIYEVRKLQNELQMLMRYRDLVHRSRDAVQEDLDALREHVDPERMPKDGSTLTEDELNSLLVVAHKRISHLQNLVMDTEEKEKARIASAFDAQRRANEELIADFVKRELERERNMHELDRYRWELEHRDALQHEQRLAVARHSEHLSQMLRLKQDEMEHQFAYRLREALAQEKVAFEAALSGWTKRMQAIEDVVDGRAELDRIAKETQALWIACEALAASLSSTSPTVADKFHRLDAPVTGSLVDYIEAIREAASSGSHPFALAILEQMSPDVAKTGVWMERGLKERFEKVYTVCRRVALVDETSASLYTYILSWLQSMLTLDVFSHKYLQTMSWFNKTNQPLLNEDSEWDESNPMDTFRLLRSAKAALSMEPASDGSVTDDGIELAVRLLGQLKGQSRVVAADWLGDAMRYLETKQAAQALLAYAAARGMSTFQKRL